MTEPTAVVVRGSTSASNDRPRCFAAGSWTRRLSTLCLVTALLAGCAATHPTPTTPSESTSTTPQQPTASRTPRSHDADIIAEYNGRMIECFKDEGMIVTKGDMGWEFGGPGTDPELAKTVIRLCAEKIGEPPLQPPSEKEASAMYDGMLATRMCLLSHGYHVSAPPTRESWIDTYISGGDYWSPYLDLQDTPQDVPDCPEPKLADLG